VLRIVCDSFAYEALTNMGADHQEAVKTLQEKSQTVLHWPVK
jgi:hypothetical protein